MDTSKIVVDALEFQDGLKAVLAVAPKAEPNDLVQFRIVSDSLIICARTQWELIAVEISTHYVDMNYERDEAFEITRNEAVALSSMRMKKDDEEDDPRLGLLVHEKYVLRTDETGLGLGLRSVKVKRHGNHYETALGNIPRVLHDARRATPTTRRPMMEPKQVGMVAAAFRSWSKNPTIWTTSSDEATVVRNVVAGSGITMVLMSSQFEGEAKKKQTIRSEGEEAAADFVDVPLDMEIIVIDGEKHAKATVTANPPGGIA
ncbi:hypothetical protein AALI21_02850 [Corynebacteriaceae bacterium 6-324]